MLWLIFYKHFDYYHYFNNKFTLDILVNFRLIFE